MNILYTDGYTIRANPSEEGGGFVVIDKKGIIHHQEIAKKGFTNNEAELLGLLYAVSIATRASYVSTDSQNSLAWVKSGKPKARPDLQPIAQMIKSIIKLKKLNVIWQGRDDNLAGIYIEKMQYEKQVARLKI